MKNTIRRIILVVFLFQIGYLSYNLPIVILLGDSFSPEIKLSAVIAGLCLGGLWILKDWESPLR